MLHGSERSGRVGTALDGSNYQGMKRFLGYVWAIWASCTLAIAQPLLDVEQAICASVNENRQQARVKSVVLDRVLSDVARKHSEDMLEQGYFSHVSSNAVCRTLRDRLKHGNRFCLAQAENLYKCEGYPREVLARSAMSEWLHSPTHHKHLLNHRFNRLGVGVAQQGGTSIFTQIFSYEPVILQSLEVIPDSGGYLVRLTALVAEGARQGGLFVEGRRQTNWHAGPDSTFTAEVRMPRAGMLQIGQLVGPRDWAIDTEVPIPPPQHDAEIQTWIPRWISNALPLRP